MLKKLREKIGYTQQELSTATKVSIKTISNIENGKDCSIRAAKNLATFFGTTIEDIIEKE